MDIQTATIATGFVQMLKYIQILLEIASSLDETFPTSDGTRTVYTDSHRGGLLASQLRSGAERRLINTTRLSPNQFESLLQWLLSNTNLKDSKHVSAAEKLIIFLYICAHDVSYRGIQKLVHHSTSTIHAAFTEVLDSLCILHQEVVKLPPDETPTLLKQSKKFFPMFKDAIGALDGTHIPIAVQRGQSKDTQAPWRCRKGYNAQNVLAAVDFSMNFVYVLAGWEGSAHDSRVLRYAITEKGFHTPPNRYYLADAAYGSHNGICLTPYQKVRYHLQEWGTANQRPETPEELFNLRHSSLRIIIERTFGVLKNRFRILTSARDGFSIITQVKIIFALTAVHNFMNNYGADPEAEWAEIERNQDSDQEITNSYNDSDPCSAEIETRRDQIAELMWRLYNEELSRAAVMSIENDAERVENSAQRTH